MKYRVLKEAIVRELKSEDSKWDKIIEPWWPRGRNPRNCPKCGCPLIQEKGSNGYYHCYNCHETMRFPGKRFPNRRLEMCHGPNSEGYLKDYMLDFIDENQVDEKGRRALYSFWKREHRYYDNFYTDTRLRNGDIVGLTRAYAYNMFKRVLAGMPAG